MFSDFNYAIINPFYETTEFIVTVIAHFAYFIRKFDIDASKYNFKTGKKTGKVINIISKRDGDLITTNLKT
ncbi:MAG: hypothetical protein FJ150_05290 [Euryarchaeota archaeon]|nr:hypothetical protein [Euryarchaeota archaeon]